MSKRRSPIRVLVVEDEPSLNEAYVRILEAENMIVESSFNGREALDSVRDFIPDVILLDLKMPIMNGIEFLKQFNKLRLKTKPEIIIFSNYDEQTEIKDAFELGATKYMLKAWAAPKEVVKVVKAIATDG
jgi:DNA-binding response OmpR family regulator